MLRHNARPTSCIHSFIFIYILCLFPTSFSYFSLPSKLDLKEETSVSNSRCRGNRLCWDFCSKCGEKGLTLKPVVSISAYGIGETTDEKNRGEDHMRSSKLLVCWIISIHLRLVLVLTPAECCLDLKIVFSLF